MQGEEITDVYSGTAFKSSKEDREEVHSRYNFKCCCHACKEGWPTQEKLVRKHTSYLSFLAVQDSSIGDIVTH